MTINPASTSPEDVITEVRDVLHGLPACIAGSTVAAYIYDLPLGQAADVDVFAYTEYSLVTGIEKLSHAGWSFNDRFERVWARWMNFGLHGWHTNSMKMVSPTGVETNLVYKKTGGNALSSLAAVLESFDFGLLGAGYDLSDMTQGSALRDMREYLFGTTEGPLPLMPNKREAWRSGFISQYNGLREAGRYAKYHQYGHDMSHVKDDLVLGYGKISSYLRDRGDVDKVLLADIYDAIRLYIEDDNIDKLADAGKKIPQLDQLDLILEELE